MMEYLPREDGFPSGFALGKTILPRETFHHGIPSGMSYLYNVCWQCNEGLLSFQGIIYMDQNVLGWRPIAKAWLENRTQMEVHVSYGLV